ncbi:hypothetical protein BCV70DRAFT_218147 [Testicularia cyperi]|uniref:Uncharacterized protein n=1 Tax=Testicularia cyperi TaxID=1882483 RepID=A0A317XPI4_9BASI|nr:hypothetical protein BCV70DRAFT_218147 [Testicularia cyperi]
MSTPASGSRSRASSDASTSSSVAAPSYSASSRSNRHSRDESPSSPSSSIKKLLQLAVVALLLALVVPYVRSHIFGSSSSSSASSNPASAALKNPHHPTHPRLKATPSANHDHDTEPSVFDFTHRDYLVRNSGSDTTRDAVVPISDAQDLSEDLDDNGNSRPARRRANSGSTPSSRSTSASRSKLQRQQRTRQQQKKSRSRRAQNDEDDDDVDYEDDDEQDQESEWHPSRSLHWLRSAFSLLYSTALFASIPFQLLYHAVVFVVLKGYFGFRWGLSHTLRPVVVGFAPLTYLVAGMVYIFIQVPGRVLGVVVRELYPVYIFLGAASVMGITMGLLAAGILYITAFVFVDRVKDPTSSLPIQHFEPQSQGKGMHTPDTSDSSPPFRPSSKSSRRKSNSRSNKSLRHNLVKHEQDDDDAYEDLDYPAARTDNPDEGWGNEFFKLRQHASGSGAGGGETLSLKPKPNPNPNPISHTGIVIVIVIIPKTTVSTVQSSRSGEFRSSNAQLLRASA